jgi:PKD repeat protein
MSSIADLFIGQNCKQDFKIDWVGGVKDDFKIDFAYTAPGTVAPTDVPVASFTSNLATGEYPLTVQFTDTSTNTPTSWFWTFSNGTTSTVQNPSVTFETEGTYDVTLTVTNANGTDTQTISSFILVTAPHVDPAPQEPGVTPAPVAALTATPLTGVAPLTVQFTDNSTGNVTNWEWDFDDSDTSTEQNPLYTFTRPGTYDITLMVTGAGGSNTGTRAGYITVTAPA